MFNDTTLITTIANLLCIFFLLLMLIILVAATRMKNGAGWAAIILVTLMLPTSLANLTRSFAPNYFVWSLYPYVFISILWLPSLWFFTRSQLDESFRFSARHLWHIIPAVISLISTILYYAPLTAEQMEIERVALIEGTQNMPLHIVHTFAIIQITGYFAAIFFYIRKRKKYLLDNYSNSKLTNIQWLVSFLISHFVFFLISIIIFAIDTSTEPWVVPIIYILTMSYLVYVVIYYSPVPYFSRFKDIPRATTPLPAMTTMQMQEICNTVITYLNTTQVYKNCDFTLATLAHETGIPNGKISTAINTHLKRNFFEIVNTMRIEEAKKLLKNLDAKYTVDSIASECGFRSSSTFFSTFKKMEGVSPAQWVKMSTN